MPIKLTSPVLATVTSPTASMASFIVIFAPRRTIPPPTSTLLSMSISPMALMFKSVSVVSVVEEPSPSKVKSPLAAAVRLFVSTGPLIAIFSPRIVKSWLPTTYPLLASIVTSPLPIMATSSFNVTLPANSILFARMSPFKIALPSIVRSTSMTNGLTVPR